MAYRDQQYVSNDDKDLTHITLHQLFTHYSINETILTQFNIILQLILTFVDTSAILQTTLRQF